MLQKILVSLLMEHLDFSVTCYGLLLTVASQMVREGGEDDPEWVSQVPAL